MKRVIGIGGIFLKAENPKTLAKWYETHLGIPIDYSFDGFAFDWKSSDERPDKGYTLWSLFKKDTDYLEPGTKDFMVNFIVDDLKQLLEALESEGIDQVDEMQDTEFGKFAWIMDPENNKIELWEPTNEI